MTNTTRDPFPVDQFDGHACPSCQNTDGLVYADKAPRYWSFARHDETSKLFFHGSFDWGDGGEDDHIFCPNCLADWDVPDNMIDFL